MSIMYWVKYHFTLIVAIWSLQIFDIFHIQFFVLFELSLCYLKWYKMLALRRLKNYSDCEFTRIKSVKVYDQFTKWFYSYYFFLTFHLDHDHHIFHTLLRGLFILFSNSPVSLAAPAKIFQLSSKNPLYFIRSAEVQT